MATIRDLLTAPWILRAETVLGDSDEWIRTAAYPELGCHVAGRDFLALLDELEVQRVQALLETVAAGAPPQHLRPPVPADGLEQLLDAADRGDWVARLDEPLPEQGRGATES